MAQGDPKARVKHDASATGGAFKEDKSNAQNEPYNNAVKGRLQFGVSTAASFCSTP